MATISKNTHFITRCIHAGISPDPTTGALLTPIYQTATFSQQPTIENQVYDYSRSGNPTRSVVEKVLAELENANFSYTFSSGMAAITAVVELLSAGDHIIFCDDIYGGIHRLLTQLVVHRDITVTAVDSTNLNNVAAAIKDNTRLVLIERPSSPLQKVTDIYNLAKLLHKYDILLAVDNSLLSPWLQQPLQLGADIVIHSATKYLAGHGDLLAGVVAVNNAELAERIAFIQNTTGSALVPFPAWLLLRGLKTLGLRIEKQQENAYLIVDYLNNHPDIKCVYYTKLSNHPNAAIQKKQVNGFCSVISFTTGFLDISKKIVESARLFLISVSFGSLNSLISLPCRMSHAAILEQKRQLPEDLIRLSIGIEAASDLIADLDQAITSITNFYKQRRHHDKVA